MIPAELHESNVFEIQSLRTQLTDTYLLLGECRSLLEITALESPLRKDILDLILRIDTFKGDADAH